MLCSLFLSSDSPEPISRRMAIHLRKKEGETPQLQTAATTPTSLHCEPFHISERHNGNRRGCENPAHAITQPRRSRQSYYSHPLLRFDCGLSNKSCDNNMTRATNDVQGRRRQRGMGALSQNGISEAKPDKFKKGSEKKRPCVYL